MEQRGKRKSDGQHFKCQSGVLLCAPGAVQHDSIYIAWLNRPEYPQAASGELVTE